MNDLDLHAVPDPTPAEESAYDDYLQGIVKLDGRALLESGPDLIDGLLDTFRDLLDVPLGRELFVVPPEDTPWSGLSGHDRAVWETLATAMRGMAVVYLDEDYARNIAAEA